MTIYRGANEKKKFDLQKKKKFETSQREMSLRIVMGGIEYDIL